MSAVPSDPGRERTALSIGGVTHVPPDELGLARTQTPPPVALDPARTPRPADLDRTHTTSDERTPPPDGDDAASASPLVAATVLSNGDGASRLARPPPADEDPRVKDLVRARLFRNKAKPVKIGRFTVLGRLGEGGMGIVYTAYDDQLDRKVAVKVLRGEATRQDQLGRTRLLREAQAMARLSHPNIVTVHEVGALDDQVFVAMEFVRGQSLDGWLRRQPRAWRDVLLVFRQAGRGLEAAHRAGIVHRDFKPHNVLVGDDGSIKVLDFGLARAAEHPGSEELAATPEGGAYNHSQGNLLDAPLTRTGAIMGTPAYMAPEQHSGLPATALSDQFSFCVSLWEGLYGAHPFDCTTLATLIAGVSTGELREPPAAKVPARLRRALLRGLSVEPAQRWPSMTELLAELARDPAQARRRWLVTAGLAGFVGAASFGAASLLPAEVAVCQGAAEELVGAWDDARAAAVERALLATGVPYAADTWSRVRPRLDAYAAEWTAMRTEACETHRAAKQSDQLFDLRTACLDQRRASLTALVEILAAADASVVEKAVGAAASMPPISTCGDSQALTQAVPPPEDPATRERVVVARRALAEARAYEDTGRYAAGKAVVEAVLADARATVHEPLLAEALLQAGSLAMQSGDSESAQRDLDRALRLAIASDHDDVAALAAARAMFARSELALQPLRALQDAPIAEAFAHSVDKEPRILAEFQNNLGVVQLNAGDLPAALATTTEALALKRRTFPADHPEIALTRSNLAFVELQNRRIDAAVAEFSGALRDAERSLGSGHPAVASIEYNLGHALRLHGRPKAASEHLERGLAIFTANLGEDATGAHFYTLELAAAALELRDAERAATLYARAERQILAGPGAASPFMATLRAGLGDLAAARGDLPRARAEYEDALALRSRIYGEHHPDLVHDHQAFGETLLAAGAPEAAVEHLRRALAVAERSLPFESPRIAETLEALGRAELRAGRAEAGLAALLRALRLREATLAPNSLEIGRSLLSLGEARLSQNESLEAAALLRRAEAILATGSAEDPELAAARFALARALAAAEPDAARSLARAALTGLRARGPAYAREADEVEAWLAGLAP